MLRVAFFAASFVNLSVPREEDLDLSGSGIGEHASCSIVMRMSRQNRADYPVRVIQNVEISMSDGVRFFKQKNLHQTKEDQTSRRKLPSVRGFW